MENSPPYRALALDLGTNCGYALLQNRRIVESGVVSFHLSSDLPNASGFRQHRFYNWLIGLAARVGGVNEVFYEHNHKFQAGEKAVRVYYGMLGLVDMFCFGAHILAPMPIYTMTLKKRFTGSGKATKEEVCARAMDLGWRGGTRGTALSNDEADAVALLHAVMWDRGEEIGF